MLDADADGRKRGGRFILADGKVRVHVGRPSGAGRDYEFYRHEAGADPCGRVHDGRGGRSKRHYGRVPATLILRCCRVNRQGTRFASQNHSTWGNMR